jgi:hypothetical protein
LLPALSPGGLRRCSPAPGDWLLDGADTGGGLARLAAEVGAGLSVVLAGVAPTHGGLLLELLDTASTAARGGGTDRLG